MNFKNLAALAALTLFSYNSYAQSQFYLRPYIGGGISNALNRTGVSLYNLTNPIPVKQGGINIGYNRGHWRFEAGLSYLESGYTEKDIYFDYYYYTYFSGNVSHQDAIGTFNYRFTHLMIPVNAGYKINVGKKFNIVPMLGLGISYNTGSKYWYVTGGKKLPKMDGNYGMHYRKISAWASAHIALEYKISKVFSVNLDPQFNLMPTNMEPTGNLNERHYTATATAGICWWLNHKRKAAETNPPVKM